MKNVHFRKIQRLSIKIYFRISHTWSCTSLSQSSRHNRFSKGLNSASLKWKCGNSTCSFNKAAIESWMHWTAFLEMLRSLWQAASMKWGPKMLQTYEQVFILLNELGISTLNSSKTPENIPTLIIWIRGLPLFTHFSMTSPNLANSNTFISFSLGLLRLHQNLLLSLDPSDVLNNWALLALQKAVRNKHSARRFNFNAAFSKSLSTCCDRTQMILAA